MMLLAANIRFKKSVQVILWFFGVLCLILFIEARHQNKALSDIHIKIKKQDESNFLDEEEIKRLLTESERTKIQGTLFKNLSIKSLESRVKANLFVDKCEIARNLKGDLFVEVVQAKPIARFIREGKPDFYVDSLGKIMPVSAKYTTKLTVVTRENNTEFPDFEEKDKEFLKLLNYIYKDKFFKAQIAQIDINKYNEISFYTQVGKQVIQFGTCENATDKLKRLKVFYKKILPLKGWDAYKKVSLKFDNQIICE